MQYTYTQKKCLEVIREEKKRSFAIVTDFGVVDISKKEAIRMVGTCECDFIVISLSPGQFILEYPT